MGQGAGAWVPCQTLTWGHRVASAMLINLLVQPCSPWRHKADEWGKQRCPFSRWLGKCKVSVLDLLGSRLLERASWAFRLRLMGIQSFLTDFIACLLGASTFLGPREPSEPVPRSSPTFGTCCDFFSWFVAEGTAAPRGVVGAVGSTVTFV